MLPHPRPHHLRQIEHKALRRVMLAARVTLDEVIQLRRFFEDDRDISRMFELAGGLAEVADKVWRQRGDVQ